MHTDTCDNHHLHNAFGDALNFLDNPHKFKKFLYTFRHSKNYDESKNNKFLPIIDLITYLNTSYSFFRQSLSRF